MTEVIQDVCKSGGTVAEDSPLSIWVSGEISVQVKNFEPIKASLMIQRFVNRPNPTDEQYAAEIAAAQGALEAFLGKQYEELEAAKNAHIANGTWMKP